MNDKNKLQLAIQWFINHGIEAYSVDMDCFIVLDDEEQTHILISQSEVEHRAELEGENTRGKNV